MPKGSFHKFTAENGVEYELTLQEKLFCEKYLEFKGSGVDAIYEAGYKPKNRMVAYAMGSEMLRKEHISAYINVLLTEYGYTDDNVTKQHLFLINQFGDLTAKARGVDMFHKIKGNYAAQKFKIIDENADLTDEEIAREIARKSGQKPADPKA